MEVELWIDPTSLGPLYITRKLMTRKIHIMLETLSNLVAISYQHATHHILGQKERSPMCITYDYRSQHMVQGDHIAGCVV